MTLICSTANVSRFCTPESRMPSTKIELRDSKPRMTGRSAEGLAAASPPRNVTPGTVFRASASVVALVCLMTSSGITVTERGVSSSGATNLYDGSALVCIGESADTTAVGRVASDGLPAVSEADWAWAKEGVAMPVQDKAHDTRWRACGIGRERTSREAEKC